MWTWAFNSADDIYSTCFDVTVAKNKIERDRLLHVKFYVLFFFSDDTLNVLVK